MYKCIVCNGITDNPDSKTITVPSIVFHGAVTPKTVLICALCGGRVAKLKE